MIFPVIKVDILNIHETLCNPRPHRNRSTQLPALPPSHVKSFAQREARGGAGTFPWENVCFFTQKTGKTWKIIGKKPPKMDDFTGTPMHKNMTGWVCFQQNTIGFYPQQWGHIHSNELRKIREWNGMTWSIEENSPTEMRTLTKLKIPPKTSKSQSFRAGLF